MIQDFKFPLRIEPEELDTYLAKGWYRMGQCIFTTDFVERDGVYFKTIWLRNCLKTYKISSSFQKLEKRNKQFNTEFIPFNYSNRYENLFQKYRSSLPPGRAGDLHSFLIGDSAYLIFNSLVINVYDNGNLIGAGVFDLGKKSAAGISSFYDPDYKRFSIGRYLIYKKIEYCQQNGYDYFYPGYFVPGIKAFDYKLEIGKESLEFYDMDNKKWKPLSCYH
jgi:arginyl-tRNA--protein-N-Asp/Glu arginylyltransferase